MLAVLDVLALHCYGTILHIMNAAAIQSCLCNALLAPINVFQSSAEAGDTRADGAIISSRSYIQALGSCLYIQAHGNLQSSC